MAELKAGVSGRDESWNDPEEKIDALDPAGLFIPRGPEDVEDETDPNIRTPYPKSEWDSYKTVEKDFPDKPEEKMTEASRAEVAAKRVKTLKQLSAKGLSASEIMSKINPSFYGSRAKVPAAFKGVSKFGTSQAIKLLRSAGEDELAAEFEAHLQGYHDRKAAEEAQRQARRDAKSEVISKLPRNPFTIAKVFKNLNRADLHDDEVLEQKMAAMLGGKVRKKLSPETSALFDDEEILDMFLDEYEDILENIMGRILGENVMNDKANRIAEGYADRDYDDPNYEPKAGEGSEFDDYGFHSRIGDEGSYQPNPIFDDEGHDYLFDNEKLATFSDRAGAEDAMNRYGGEIEDTDVGSFRLRRRRETVTFNEALEDIALASETFDDYKPGYREFYFDMDGLQKLSDLTGVSVEELKEIALPTDGFDSETLENAGLPEDYEEFAFDANDIGFEDEIEEDIDLDSGAEDEVFVENTAKVLQALREMDIDEEELENNVPADADIPNPQAAGDGDPAPEPQDIEYGYETFDTFEHALGGAPEKDGGNPLTHTPIHEGSLFDRKLRREATLLREKRYREAKAADAISDYIGQAEKPTYNDYVSWAEENGHSTVARGTFNKYKNAIVGGEVPSSRKAAAEPEPPKDPVDLGDLVDEEDAAMLGGSFTDESTVDLLRPETTVDERYDELFSVVKYWAKEPKKPGEDSNDGFKISGNARHVLVYGNPGIGKTHTVLEAVRSAMSEGIEFETQYVRGSLGGGGNAKGVLYKFFETFGEGFLVIFDDADTLLDMKGGDANIIKALMEPNNPYTAINSSGILRSMDNTAEPAHMPVDMEESIGNYLKDDALGIMSEGLMDADDEEFMLDNDEGDDDYVPDDDLDEDKAIIINMRSRLLFISNRRKDQIDDAIFDRVIEAPLVLSSIEVVDRINQLLGIFLAKETMFPQERIQWAKNNAFKWLKLAVASEGAPIRFPNGGTLQFPSIMAPGQDLTFRNYIALVYDWLKKADIHQKNNPQDGDLMSAKVLPPTFLRQFLIRTLLPTMKSVAGEMNKKKK